MATRRSASRDSESAATRSPPPRRSGGLQPPQPPATAARSASSATIIASIGSAKPPRGGTEALDWRKGGRAEALAMAAERAVGERRSPPFCVCGGRLRASLPAAEAAEPRPGSRRGLSPAGSSGSQLTWPPLACCCLPGQLGETEKQKRLPVAGAEGMDPKLTDFRQRPPWRALQNLSQAQGSLCHGFSAFFTETPLPW